MKRELICLLLSSLAALLSALEIRIEENVPGGTLVYQSTGEEGTNYE